MCQRCGAGGGGLRDVGQPVAQPIAPFDAACREALPKTLRGLEAVACQRAVEGREMVVIRGGREVERRIAPSVALLALLTRRGELVAGTSGGAAVKAAAEGRGSTPRRRR